MKGKCVFTYQIPYPTAVTMMLRPRRESTQAIFNEGFIIEPTVHFTEFTDSYGNSCQRATLPQGEVKITSQVEANVLETPPLPNPLPPFVPIEELPDEAMLYVLPSRYCQSDLYEIHQLASQIVGNSTPGYEQVEAIRKWVHQNIYYQYGVTNATTTALDLVYNRTGVCRDFTHLVISLCRSLNIPARMTVGYLDKLEIMDLHAWVEAFLGDQWYPIDAVQEFTHGYRIEIGHGRDAADVAMVTQFGSMQLQSLDVETELLEEDPSAQPAQ
ncbi:transglutaminase-like domain-containing protein [Arundinibacter roseus]|nr:transglutaminase family protein [Arundinibacter roseus]